MKNLIRKKLTGIFSCVLCVSLLLSSAVFANNGAEDRSINGAYPILTSDKVLSSVITDAEDNFNLPTVAWEISGGKAEALSFFDNEPYSSYEGSRSLKITKDADTVTLSKTPTVLTAADEYYFYTLTVWVPAETPNASVTLKLKTDDEEYSSSQKLVSGGWQTLFFDMSNAQGHIENISLSFSSSNNNGVFIIDCFGACKNENEVFAAKYMTYAFALNKCVAEENEKGNTVLTLQGENPSFEFAPVISEFSDGIGIKVRYINSSNAASLTLSFKGGEDTEYGANNSITVDLAQGEGECIFNVPSESVSSIKFDFYGLNGGSFEIISISEGVCCTSDKKAGNISEIRVSRDKKSISFKGSVYGEYAEAYLGCELLVYELLFSQTVSDITPSMQPKYEGKLNGSSFSFSIPLDENLDGIYKKYAVMINCGGELVPLCSPKAVSNPDIFASEKAVSPSGIKGSGDLGSNYFLDGICQTTVEINPEKLLTNSGSGEAFVSGGRRYIFSSSYLSEIDSKMKEYDRENIAVRFILRMSKPEDISLSSLLCHPEYDGNGYPAFNTETAEGANALRAVTELLVSRYGTDNGVSDNLTGIILGSSVNNSYQNYNMSGAVLNELVRSYGSAFRTVYNAAAGILRDFDVSISVGGRWYKNDTAYQKYSFEGSSFINAFASLIKEETDIEWSLAYDITPKSGSYAYEEKNADMSIYAENITAANLEVLASYMKKQELIYNGASRDIILCGTEKAEISDENEYIKLSADYIYSYLRCMEDGMSAIKAYIPSHTVGYEDGIRYVGTNMLKEKTVFASELIGEERYNELVLKAQSKGVSYFGMTSAGGVIPSAIKGQTKLFDFSSDTDGWLPSANCASAEGGVSYGSTHSLMRVRLNKAEGGEYGGIYVKPEGTVDLSAASYICFDIRVAGLNSSVKELETLLVMYSDNGIHIGVSKIKTGVNNTFVCDISTFPYASSCQKIAIYVRGINGQDIGEPTLLISSLSALSTKLSDSALNEAIKNPDSSAKTVKLSTVAALSSVSVLCIALLVIRTIKKIKQD